MKTLKFKLYSHKRNRYLKQSINAAGVIYNHCVALHRRYYRMFKKHLASAKLQSHIAKLRKRNPFWQLVGSQAVQDICQRIEKAYQMFFKYHNRGVKPNKFDVLCFETLNLKRDVCGGRFPRKARLGMQRLWGRKVSDLAFGEFLQILEWVARKKDKKIVYIDRWYPSTKTCSCCGHVLDELDLSVRRWRCPSCHAENDRDENASINIKMVGASTIGLGNVRQSKTAIAV